MIKIHRGIALWEADFVGDKVVQALFGTTILPTPFSRNEPPEVVSCRLALMNPTHIIMVDE